MRGERGTRVIQLFCSPWEALRKEGGLLTVHKKVVFKARPVELLFTFCPNLSNCQSACEVCCSDVNVIPNLSIVPKSYWWSHWNWLNSIQKTGPFYPASRGFSQSCMAFSVGSRLRRFWRQRERLKKTIGWKAKQLCTCITLFLYISLPFLRDYDVKIPNFVFYGERKQTVLKILFRFLKSNTVTWKSNSGGFPCIWQSN